MRGSSQSPFFLLPSAISIATKRQRERGVKATAQPSLLKQVKRAGEYPLKNCVIYFCISYNTLTRKIFARYYFCLHYSNTQKLVAITVVGQRKNSPTEGKERERERERAVGKSSGVPGWYAHEFLTISPKEKRVKPTGGKGFCMGLYLPVRSLYIYQRTYGCSRIKSIFVSIYKTVQQKTSI